MAVLTLPVVIVATEESLRSVPRELREASLALGATKFQTVLNVVLPQATPGILTGTILAISRGAGEVAPILFTGAAYYLPQLPWHPNSQFMHLGYHVYVLATQSPDVDAAKPLLYSTVLVLLAVTFVLNLVGVRRAFAHAAPLRGSVVVTTAAAIDTARPKLTVEGPVASFTERRRRWDRCRWRSPRSA